MLVLWIFDQYNIREKYEKVMSDYRRQVEELLREREEGSLAKWKSSEVELNARAKYEEEVRAKYPYILALYEAIGRSLFNINNFL